MRWQSDGTSNGTKRKQCKQWDTHCWNQRGINRGINGTPIALRRNRDAHALPATLSGRRSAAVRKRVVAGEKPRTKSPEEPRRAQDKEEPRTPIIPKSPGLKLAISPGSASSEKVGVPCHRRAIAVPSIRQSGCPVPSSPCHRSGKVGVPYHRQSGCPVPSLTLESCKPVSIDYHGDTTCGVRCLLSCSTKRTQASTPARPRSAAKKLSSCWKA